MLGYEDDLELDDELPNEELSTRTKLGKNIDYASAPVSGALEMEQMALFNESKANLENASFVGGGSSIQDDYDDEEVASASASGQSALAMRGVALC